MKRTATAAWNGSIKEGEGVISTQSQTLNKTAYSYSSRFESGTGTNPEELIAAAHAGCFTMAVCNELGKVGFTPASLETTCTITLENGTITSSHLLLRGSVPGCNKEDFQKNAENAKVNCPVSKLLNTNISLEIQN